MYAAKTFPSVRDIRVGEYMAQVYLMTSIFFTLAFVIQLSSKRFGITRMRFKMCCIKRLISVIK